jgi:plastocyanin
MIEDRPRTDLPPTEEEEGPRFPPIAYPLLGLLFAGILVWSLSRILLAVSKDQAVAVAIFMATNVLVASALVAYGRRVRRRPASFPLIVAAGVALVAAGIVAFTFGDRPPGELAEGGGGGGARPVPLTASGIKFLEPEITLPAGGPVAIDFRNQDTGVQHDFVLFDGSDATATELFDGPEITGVDSTVYTFPAPPPGSYFFHCSIHPTQMTGTALVREGPPPGGGQGGGAPGPVEVTAKDIAFAPTDLSLPAHGEVTIRLVNEDASVPHNIAIFKGQDASGDLVFRGDVIDGPGETDYTFPAPPPGTYFFHCDIHPTQMTGTITVG